MWKSIDFITKGGCILGGIVGGIVGGIIGGRIVGGIVVEKGTTTFDGHKLKHSSYEGHIGYLKLKNNTVTLPTDLCVVCRNNNNINEKIHYTQLNNIISVRQMYDSEHENVPENWPQINDPLVVNYVNNFFKEDQNHIVRLQLTIPLPKGGITWAHQYYCYNHVNELWQDINRTTGINHLNQ